MLIGPDGSVGDPRTRAAAATTTPCCAAYGALVTARRLNDQAYALVRQGRLAVYPSSHGQEACQVAAAQVLGRRRLAVPHLPGHRRRVARGVDPVEALTLLKGDWHCGYDPYEHHVAPQATPLATQLPHAVGVAHAARLRGEPTVVMALCGDGAHQRGRLPRGAQLRRGLPGAGRLLRAEQRVRDLASRWPASPPRRRWRTRASATACPASASTATTSAALLAVLGAAVERARAGAGPQLVEAHTYRMQAHTNADDATRYRDDDEVAAWVGARPARPAGARYLTRPGRC